MMVSERNRPWNPGGEVTHVLFKISDMSVPMKPRSSSSWSTGPRRSWRPARRCTAAASAAMGAPACSSQPWSPASASPTPSSTCARTTARRWSRAAAQVEFLVKYFGVKSASAHKGFDDGYSSTKKTSGSKQVEGADDGQGDLLPDRQQRLHLGMSAGGSNASNCTNFLAMTRHCAIVISGNRVHGG